MSIASFFLAEDVKIGYTRSEEKEYLRTIVFVYNNTVVGVAQRSPRGRQPVTALLDNV